MAMMVFQLAEIDVAGIYREFLRVPAFSLGLYVHAAGQDVPQEPHEEDEVYHVISGAGQIAVNGTDHAVSAGSVVYVPAAAPHHFHSVTEKLTALVAFAPAEGTATRP